MKKKLGFTLVEILAAITILAIIGMILTTTVTHFLKKGKSDLYNRQLDNIKMSAKVWVSDNKNNISELDNCFSISINYLMEQGYIDNNIINPKTGSKLDTDKLYVNISREEKRISYEVSDDESNKCNEYRGDIDE